MTDNLEAWSKVSSLARKLLHKLCRMKQLRMVNRRKKRLAPVATSHREVIPNGGPNYLVTIRHKLANQEAAIQKSNFEAVVVPDRLNSLQQRAYYQINNAKSPKVRLPQWTMY
uniref:Uncharacterized protein n=1 Tax=Glossina austeni TaxID=7395 RepID=A0A1A9VDH7_GLOAU